MTQSVNITEVGRKYLQLFNIPLQTKQSQTTSTPTLPLVKQSSTVHQSQLRQLPFRLNKLYTNSIIKQAQNQLKQSIKCLQKQVLKDLGYSNKYTTKKAEQLVKKIYTKNSKQDEQKNLIMQLSKSRNYLSRINYLHIQQNNKYQSIKKAVHSICHKENIQ